MSASNISRSGLAQSAVNYMTPECARLGGSIKMVSIVGLVMIVLALILIIAGIVYNYVKKTTGQTTDETKANEDKKQKLVGGLTITGAVFLAVTSLIQVWQYSVASKVANQCIGSS